MLEKLKTTFGNCLGLPPDTEFEALKYRAVQQWDSTAHMILVANLESEFDVMLSTEDVLGLSSFQRAVEILGQHGIDFRA